MNEYVKKCIELWTAYGEAAAKKDETERLRLYREADALTPHVIRANLENFGITDMNVTGVIYFHKGQEVGRSDALLDGREAGRIDLLLSDLCGLGSSGLAKRLGQLPENVKFEIVVEKDGQRIGHIDSDERFDFEEAPDLRTALGWLIATDGGRVNLIEFFDLDKATATLLEVIRANSISHSSFFGPYRDAMIRVIVYERTSRFSDGYCSALTILWRVATRELGEWHPGYPFAH